MEYGLMLMLELPQTITSVAMFNEVWGMAMSTILQCFCADEEIYKGDKDAMYAGSDLKATVSNSNKGKFAKKSKVAAAPAEEPEPAPKRVREGSVSD